MTPAQRAAAVEALPAAMTAAELPREETERRLEESEARVRALEAELARLRGG
jgi:hypothetical protein